MTERQCAVYARYSSEKQNSLTIEQQVRECREYAERHGFTVLDAHIYTDEAICGATDNRAGLQRLLAAATQKPRAFDVILVDDTSRLSRNMIDSLKIFEQPRFVEGGVAVTMVPGASIVHSSHAISPQIPFEIKIAA